MTDQPIETPNVNPDAEKPEALTPQAKPEQVSERFRAAAQREKMANQRMREAKALQAQLQEAQKRVEDFEQHKAQARLNPLKALESLGLSYEDVAQYMVNGGKPSAENEIKSVREEFENWKKEQLEKENAQKEMQKKSQEEQEQKAIQDFTKKIESYVDQNKDSLKFVNAYGGNQIILAHCIEHAKRTGEVLDLGEAAKAAESYLMEEWKKGQALIAPPAAEGATPEARKTLNNSMSQVVSTAPSLLPAKTENERLKRALAALGG